MKKLSAFIALSALLLASCNHQQPTAKTTTDERIPVKVMEVTPLNGAAQLHISGQFTTDDEAMLSFKTGGVVDRIMVKEGDAIHAGQLLATLKLTEIDALVQQATLALEKAKRDNTRATNLYKDSVATLEQLQNSKTALDLATQQLEAARFNRSYSEIRAAKDGFVLRKLAAEGQVVSSGAPVFQTNGARSSAWLLRVSLSDRQWAAISVNDKANVQWDAAGKESIAGVVVRKSQGADPVSGQIAADIKLTGHIPGGIASGMFGKAVVFPSVVKDTQTATLWTVPYDALLDADGSMGYVFVVNDDNTVKKVKVLIQGMEKDNVLISDGLQGAKSIVVSGSAYLTDNSNIRIIQ